MIKATAYTESGQVLLLGLSGENITRLFADEPILISTGDLGLPPMKIVIVAGRTDEDIKDAVRQHAKIMLA